MAGPSGCRFTDNEMVPFSLMALCLSLFAETTGLFLPDFKNALTGICLLLNPMLIGIGVWLLILLMLLSLYYFKNIKVPFGPGWWAFIFPTASVSIASLNFAVLTRSAVFRIYRGYYLRVASGINGCGHRQNAQKSHNKK